VYRVAELALDNAVRYSHASLIEVIVKNSKQGPTLEIRDDGRGFQVDEARKAQSGLGIALMEFVAARAALNVSVASEAGKGTVVTLRGHKAPDTSTDNVRLTLG
jgi:signal transduction histidine kinase